MGSEKDSQNGQNGHNGYANGNGTHTNGTKSEGSTAVSTTPYTKPRDASSGSIWSNYKKAKTQSKRPLPNEMGDGTYRQVIKRPGLGQDLRSFRKKDWKTLFDLVRSKVKGEVQQDDKTMIMERTIQLVAGLPTRSKTQEVLTNQLIDQLWNSLDHPPLLYMGNEYKWRRPDGRMNNPHMPYLGACGQPYSRTVRPLVTRPGALPDPDAIFESLMARGTFRKNPNNVSSILWYWATIVIHDLFWTNMRDGNINESSSYLDMAPLYGHNQKDCDSVRTFKNGLLKPDTFADKRLIGNPPGVCIMLIMFNRFHNHVATNLSEINENNRFPKPSPTLEGEAKEAAWKTYDEELFQTSRLVTSGLYINIMLMDYVRNIVGLNRADTTWTLDPRQEMGTSVGTKKGSEAGVGNTVSAEFNLCYRWHSCISEMDDKWIQDFFVELLGPSYGTMDLRALIGAMKKFEQSIPDDPAERTFSGFKRGPDGRFNDDELVEAMATAIEQPGGAFGGRNVPRIMKPVEMMGIMRGRKWNLAGLNEFRKHFGLKAYEKFEDINSDPAIAESLRNLYQHPDNVELYPGMVAEEAKKPMTPGVGIAPTYTISRVVLSDAVALVRGDRFYTVDYHPGNLTNWGYKEVEYDLDVNHGCVFHKLFLRAFPNHFKQNSVYAHYPMAIPSENEKILTNLKRIHMFDFERPRYQTPSVDVSSFGAAQSILTNNGKYSAATRDGTEFLLGSSSRLLTSNPTSPQRQDLSKFIQRDTWAADVKSFYATTTQKLLYEKSHAIAGHTQVDVIRDVGNLAHVHFVSHLFNISLKTTENPKGVYSEQELYTVLSAIYVTLYHGFDKMKTFSLQQDAKKLAQDLGNLVETNIKLANMLGMGGLFAGKGGKNDLMGKHGLAIAKGLVKGGMSARDVAWSEVLPTAAAMVPAQAQLFAEAVNFYLSPQGTPYINDVRYTAELESTPESDAKLLAYAMEGVRICGNIGSYREALIPDTIINTSPTSIGQSTTVNRGDQVFVSLAAATTDETYFPEPSAVHLNRPVQSYAAFWNAASPSPAGAQVTPGDGGSASPSLGEEVGKIALVEMFRAVFRKPNVRKVAGAVGELKKVCKGGAGGSCVYMSEDWGSYWPFPTTMKVTWDDVAVCDLN